MASGKDLPKGWSTSCGEAKRCFVVAVTETYVAKMKNGLRSQAEKQISSLGAGRDLN